jgi:hypothetical protein
MITITRDKEQLQFRLPGAVQKHDLETPFLQWSLITEFPGVPIIPGMRKPQTPLVARKKERKLWSDRPLRDDKEYHQEFDVIQFSEVSAVEVICCPNVCDLTSTASQERPLICLARNCMLTRNIEPVCNVTIAA